MRKDYKLSDFFEDAAVVIAIVILILLHYQAARAEGSYQLIYESVVISAAPVPEPLPALDDDAEQLHRVYIHVCDSRAIRLSLYADDDLVRSDPLDGCTEQYYEYTSVGPSNTRFVAVVHYPRRNEFCELVGPAGTCNLWQVAMPVAVKS